MLWCRQAHRLPAIAQHDSVSLLLLAAAMATWLQPPSSPKPVHDRPDNHSDMRCVQLLAGAGGVKRHEALSAANEAPLPRRSLLQTVTTDTPLPGLLVQVLPDALLYSAGAVMCCCTSCARPSEALQSASARAPHISSHRQSFRGVTDPCCEVASRAASFLPFPRRMDMLHCDSSRGINPANMSARAFRRCSNPTAAPTRCPSQPVQNRAPSPPHRT